MSDTLSRRTATRRLSDLEPQRGSRLALGAAMLALAAGSAQAAPRKPAPPAAADFTVLSGARAANCSAALDPSLAGLGAPAERRCAWGQRVEMLYWQALPDMAGSCLSAPAVAWHRFGAGMRATVVPWNSAWQGQSALLDGAVKQAGALWRRADGQWSAVLWRWRPAERAATRDWQANHWKSVLDTVRAVGAGTAMPAATPLTSAWFDTSKGKPRMLDGENWRWIADGNCLALQTAGIGQSQLHLPYSRDDVRQEQRSAMQVQLARRYPAAEFLKTFSLVEPGPQGGRTGAKFLAVWKEGAALNGQLWIALPDEGGIVRARITSGVPRGDEPLKARATLIERELTSLAHAWEARHE